VRAELSRESPLVVHVCARAVVIVVDRVKVFCRGVGAAKEDARAIVERVDGVIVCGSPVGAPRDVRLAEAVIDVGRLVVVATRRVGAAWVKAARVDVG